MLILITWASLTLAGPSHISPTTALCDTIKAQDRDTLRESVTSRSKSHPEGQPMFSSTPLFNTPFGPEIKPQQLVDTLNKLLTTRPLLRDAILKEMLLPTPSLTNSEPLSPIESFNFQLQNASELTPFERMSLIAKRYALYNPDDKSLRAYQLDIIGTILWLQEVLK